MPHFQAIIIMNHSGHMDAFWEFTCAGRFHVNKTPGVDKLSMTTSREVCWWNQHHMLANLLWWAIIGKNSFVHCIFPKNNRHPWWTHSVNPGSWVPWTHSVNYIYWKFDKVDILNIFPPLPLCTPCLPRQHVRVLKHESRTWVSKCQTLIFSTRVLYKIFVCTNIIHTTKILWC